ncbi:sugar phosphate isomerase/epimerase family protein [Loigolactobacillus coryniformis]|uniref:Sugar phosphate isomerase n=1 Tax=Loigolactobacillus coryniformis subsp. torquens DSM 20004 = KCTC 3535 TaxID=1423822 RepID=A0A2D1KSP0_9LACO|nr:TIM barrel protein [Loigolactobacillus coryniformis]ATO45166.1 sugar phosphate isomerase [Loigolactobacillus coryniformis subsp. torquens DSM 20004 = KCTC 3535]KRK75499.1 AP endonuclease, family 2 [Loigolactobacillus coryniformis subsp. torquens DSM 20004 = KCTC 3535]
MTLILNTWIFEADVKNGAKQADLVDRVAKLGADGIEVRREYFTDLASELPEVAKRAKAHNLVVDYSVPDVLFEDDGSLNPKLGDYFKEGQILGLKKIKFNIGHFDKFTGDLKAAFSQFPLDEIQMNVENDQTQVSGTVTAIKTFLDAAHAAGLTSLGYVYDLGNWAFTHGDAEEAAKVLAPYTHYIHLKNTTDEDGKLGTSDDLDTGIFDWRHLISILPSDQYYALEYPMADDAQISSQIKLFKDEVGA